MTQRSFKQTIEMLISDEGQRGPFPLEPLLRSLSGCYTQGTRLGNWLYENKLIHPHRLPCPVISIGNITVGGTGKTPMTVYLASRLVEKGYRPVILSRGYGGTASDRGGMVSDGNQMFMNATEAGDEPYMMARSLTGVPVFVGKNRYNSGMVAMAMFSPDVILLDDGFQHRKLHRDLDILMFDAAKPLGNGFLLPRGPLREPVEGMDRAHVFVLTRSDSVTDPVGHFKSHVMEMGVPESILAKPVLTCSHRPKIRCVKKAGTGEVCVDHIPVPNKDQVFAFSGIAKNDDFRRSLSHLGFQIVDFMEFSDHHPYSADDLSTVSEKAEACQASVIMTTEKDFSRLQDNVRFPLDLWVLGIDMDFGSTDASVMDTIFRDLKIAR